MFTKFIQYLLRMFSVGLAVTVAAVLFGPQAATAATMFLRVPKGESEKLHTAAITVLPHNLTAELPDDIITAKLVAHGIPTPTPTLTITLPKPTLTQTAKPRALATMSTTPTPILTPTREAASPAPSASHTVTAEPTASSTPTSEPTHSSAPSPAPKPKPSPTVSTSTVSARIAGMLSFARAQLGEPYSSPGNSYSTWDCSGLTKQAYAAVGINIGTHSATNQYNTARAKGYLVPYSQKRAGDQIFYGVLGNMYHTAIYSGNGNSIEAADWGKPVRERAIWGVPYPYVARWIR